MQPDERRETIPDEAGDVEEEISGEARSNEGMAQANSNEANAVDHAGTRTEAPWTLSVLRGDRQLPRSGAISPRSKETPLQVVESAEPTAELHVDRIRKAAKRISVATTANTSTSLLSSAKDSLRSRVR